MLTALYNKWKSKAVTGEEPVKKPGLLNLFNAAPALDMINRHIKSNSRIAVHCDVDMDGLGSGFILKRFLGTQLSIPQIYLINKEKEHGIKQKHVDYFRDNPLDLLIILDSSSNELDIIKQFNCDVIVIDHHEIDHNQFWGYTDDGQHLYIIVSNMITNLDNDTLMSWIRYNNSKSSEFVEPYTADSRMSCGLVIYELLRIFQEAYDTGPILENMMLYQWAGVTLITDAIQLLTDRNQWYMDNTVHSLSTEPTLMAIAKTLNKYAVSLDKSLIGYTIAPTFNRAIRAGATAEALNIVMDYPYYAANLQRFRELQDWAISTGIQDVNEFTNSVLKDLTNTGISSNYTGVIAGRLCDDYKKNTVVFKVSDGIAKGSFRGRLAGVDYRSRFDAYADYVKAQGHGAAFGFEAPVDELPNIMETLVDTEGNFDTRPYLTAGNLPENAKGTYHIDDINKFKQMGGLMMLGIGNSKVANDEQIMITVKSTEASLIETRGKLYLYDVLGITCKAFKEIEPGMINIYVEQSKSIEFFIK